MKALKANALYEGVYPLVSAISRPLISKHLVRAAHQFGADTISHGCTGKGNDQVRFEVSISSIDPTLKAISPIRDLSLTRDVEIAFAKEHKLPIVQTEKSPCLLYTSHQAMRHHHGCRGERRPVAGGVEYWSGNVVQPNRCGRMHVH